MTSNIKHEQLQSTVTVQWSYQELIGHATRKSSFRSTKPIMQTSKQRNLAWFVSDVNNSYLRGICCLNFTLDSFKLSLEHVLGAWIEHLVLDLGSIKIPIKNKGKTHSHSEKDHKCNSIIHANKKIYHKKSYASMSHSTTSERLIAIGRCVHHIGHNN